MDQSDMRTSKDGGWFGNPSLRRRTFLFGSAAAVAAGGGAAALAMNARTGKEFDGGLRPVCMAMHVHASASEGPASMEAQLAQAARTGVDVVWWTEHDFRMSGHDAADTVRCTGSTENTTDLHRWTWTSSVSGAPGSKQLVFCTPTGHPLLGRRPNALLIGATAASADPIRHVLSGQSENLLNRTSLAGQSISLAVCPTNINSDNFLSIELTTSFRPSRAGIPSANYVISYRFGGLQRPGTSVLANATKAAITLDAPVGRWTTVTIHPDQDIARLWPGTDGEDSSLFDFSLVAVASGKGNTAAGYATDIRFIRTSSGQRPLATQRSLITHYSDAFPTVQQLQALEVSLTTPHLGWYGGSIALPDYSQAGPFPSKDEDVAVAAVTRIHASGGIASYCHPFGTAVGELSAALQERARAQKSAELVTNRALNCDLLEVGYRLRGGCNLEQHESVWDNCSRNEIFLTGIGVNDDHKGQDWSSEILNFATWAWAPDHDMSSLLTALQAGRVFFGDLARFHGQLDLRLDGRSAMGAVSVSQAEQRTVTVYASGLPHGARVQVIRGLVDLAGPGDTTPKTSVTTLDASRFSGDGSTSITTDTRTPCFVRTVVVDSSDLPIGFSNPVWLLRASPRQGIPRSRRTAG
ncbi:MAG: hypothetical protein ACR2KJ_04175 [Jatrophihabitans sp.]